jgi:hypothetical protein
MTATSLHTDGDMADNPLAAKRPKYVLAKRDMLGTLKMTFTDILQTQLRGDYQGACRARSPAGVHDLPRHCRSTFWLLPSNGALHQGQFHTNGIYHGEAPEFIQPPADKDHPYTIPSRHEIEPVQNRLDQDFESLLKLYALADSLSDPTTANMAFEEIKKLCQSSCFNLGAGFVDLAFRSTKQGDGLRNFLADQYVYESDCLPRGNFPAAFFKLIVERFLSEKSCNIVKVDDAHVRMINGPEGSDWRRREYHQVVEQRPEGYNGTLKPERD